MASSAATNGDSSKINGSLTNGSSSTSWRAAPMSNTTLEAKAKQLREESAKHSAVLTQKLANSDSGQNLLHIGTALSSLPPDLHSALSSLQPLSAATATSEEYQTDQLTEILKCRKEIEHQRLRCRQAQSAIDVYGDLVAVEATLQQLAQCTSSRPRPPRDQHANNIQNNHNVDENEEEIDKAAELERAAQVALILVHELQSANLIMTSAIGNREKDTEYAEFVVKLAHRIRKVEQNTIARLGERMESVLNRFADHVESSSASLHAVLGHYMRGLLIMNRPKDVESIFAKVAILPLIRSRISMGRIDEGGARGECRGLKSLLEELVQEIAKLYGSVLFFTESMFNVSGAGDSSPPVVDLLTAGVWVPIAESLMTDPAVKMAVFSPGIARIMQANYIVVESFLDGFGKSLGLPDAQSRVYAHRKTTEFAKKWNLPIYYQLRFGEFCSRLNVAIDVTKLEGWVAECYTGGDKEKLRQDVGFELSLFLELYDILLDLWSPSVVIRPLANRFLRASIQLVGRVLSFVNEGLEGKLVFGDQPESVVVENGESTETDDGSMANKPPVRAPYCWGESEENVASVAWELAILESSLRHDYVETIVKAITVSTDAEAAAEEVRTIVSESLSEVSTSIREVVEKSWNSMIVKLITQKCSAPLGAVKGVAATYRMTNRPPPTQASPYVPTILRRLKDFDREFTNRIPDKIGNNWKLQIAATIAERYAAAVSDLLATVERTEAALKNRKARRTAAGTMSDGEKVKLQLYLDVKAFAASVREVGLEPSSIIGISKLEELTSEGQSLLHQKTNGS